MKLTQSGSLWGNTYRFRHYQDGVRISDATFRRVYEANNLTPEMGIYVQTTSTFRKDWIIPHARSNKGLIIQA